QRGAIARALLVQPSLLLMDEPLTGLDARRKQEILPYLENLREFAVPILYVTHAMDEVARLADHVVVPGAGRGQGQGSLADVLSDIGGPLALGEDTGVVLTGTIAERDRQWHLARIAFDGGALWVRDDGDAQGASVRVRILARDVSLALGADADSSI